MSTSSQTDSTAQRVLDVLRRIEARHADPKAWCQGTDAQDADGNAVDLRSGRAAATCLDGAYYLETWEMHYPGNNCPRRYLKQAQIELYPKAGSLVRLNDRLGYEAVRAVERRAVELAEAALAEARP